MTYASQEAEAEPSDELKQRLFNLVAGVANRLDDMEFSAIALAAQLGMDPRGRLGFDKAETLFTETHQEGYPIAHQYVRDALGSAAVQRYHQVIESGDTQD